VQRVARRVGADATAIQLRRRAARHAPAGLTGLTDDARRTARPTVGWIDAHVLAGAATGQRGRRAGVRRRGRRGLTSLGAGERKEEGGEQRAHGQPSGSRNVAGGCGSHGASSRLGGRR
jgi:hypothetical protein